MSIKPREPRIILWDIETGFDVLAAWGLYNDHGIPHENILKERYVVCACWKELGKPTVYSVSLLDDPKRFKKDPTDDYHVCRVLHQMMQNADVLVAHNGDSFDKPYVETRLIYHGFPPLPPIPTIDTKLVAKKRFRFNNNRLDYLAQYFKVGKKQETEKGLWLKVLQGDPKAVRTMLVYNKHDVRLLERVYKRLAPYAQNVLNRGFFGDHSGCPRPECGSRRIQARGIHRSLTQQYQRYVCLACGGWFRERLANKQHPHTRVI